MSEARIAVIEEKQRDFAREIEKVHKRIEDRDLKQEKEMEKVIKKVDGIQAYLSGLAVKGFIALLGIAGALIVFIAINYMIN
jgi:hypothetical protein